MRSRYQRGGGGESSMGRRPPVSGRYCRVVPRTDGRPSQAVNSSRVGESAGDAARTGGDIIGRGARGARGARGCGDDHQ